MNLSMLRNSNSNVCRRFDSSWCKGTGRQTERGLLIDRLKKHCRKYISTIPTAEAFSDKNLKPHMTGRSTFPPNRHYNSHSFSGPFCAFFSPTSMATRNLLTQLYAATVLVISTTS